MSFSKSLSTSSLMAHIRSLDKGSDSWRPVKMCLESVLAKVIEKKEDLTGEDLRKFNETFAALSPLAKSEAASLLHQALKSFYETENNATVLADSVEQYLAQGKALKECKVEHSLSYQKLLSIQSLLASTRDARDTTLEDNISLHLNLLVLTGSMEEKVSFLGKSYQAPFYPSDDGRIQRKKIYELARGIKNSDYYYPIRKIEKQHKGKVGNHTYLAVQIKKSRSESESKSKSEFKPKLIYLRSNNPNDPTANNRAVMASKIATFVSPKHFASERLLDNGLAGSRKIEDASSLLTLYDPKTGTLDEKVFRSSGVGTIDEVSPFIGDQDTKNVENFMFRQGKNGRGSSIKFDYDWCFLEKEGTSNPLMARRLHSSSTEDEEYSRERFTARLKLSLLTYNILEAWADKAKIGDEEEIIRINVALIKKTHGLLKEGFNEHNAPAEAFFSGNPGILNTILEESLEYVDKHFDDKQCVEIKKSLLTRKEAVQEFIEDQFDIDLNKTPDKYSKWIVEQEEKQEKEKVFIGSKALYLSALKTLIGRIESKDTTGAAEFSSSLNKLYYHVNGLSDQEYDNNDRVRFIVLKTNEMLTDLEKVEEQYPGSSKQKQKAKLKIVECYAEACDKDLSLGAKIKRLVCYIVLAAVGFVLGALVGGLVGMLAGAWSGPGAVFTGSVGFIMGGFKGASVAMGVAMGAAAWSGIGAGIVGKEVMPEFKSTFFGRQIWKPSEIELKADEIIKTGKKMK